MSLRPICILFERESRRPMELAEVQARVDDWIRRHGGYWDKFQILSRLTEELGEVSAALQRSSGLRTWARRSVICCSRWPYWPMPAM